MKQVGTAGGKPSLVGAYREMESSPYPSCLMCRSRVHFDASDLFCSIPFVELSLHTMAVKVGE